MPVGQGTQLVFPVPATETVIRLECSVGLCPGPDEARALATRAYQKAQDAGELHRPDRGTPASVRAPRQRQGPRRPHLVAVQPVLAADPLTRSCIEAPSLQWAGVQAVGGLLDVYFR
jgi:hypothetical protein